MPITLLSADPERSEFMDTPRPSDDETRRGQPGAGRPSPPTEILAWAVRRFHPKLMMATAFGAEGCCIIHMLAEIEPARHGHQPGHRLPVPRDAGTARAHQGALRHRGRVRPPRADGGRVRGGARRPAVRAPPGPVLPRPQDAAAAAGRRRATRRGSAPSAGPDRPTAAAAGVVQWDAKFNLVKVNPLLNWTKKDVWKFIIEARRAVQPAARPRLPEHRLLAVHAPGARPARTTGPAAGPGEEEGVRAARDRAPGRVGDLKSKQPGTRMTRITLIQGSDETDLILHRSGTLYRVIASLAVGTTATC